MPVKCNNDPIEGYNGCVRQRGKNPTPQSYMWYAKAIGLSQYLGPTQGSYELSHTESSLVELQNIKDLRKSLEEEEGKSIVTMEEEQPTLKKGQKIKDKAEKDSLGYLTGVILKRTILSQSKCQDCADSFVTADGSNKLILLKEYTKGQLTHPSKLANDIFEDIEGFFQKNQNLLKDKSKIGESLTKIVLAHLDSQYHNAPKCHLQIIVARFIKARWHFWTKQTDEKEKAMAFFKKEMEAEASSSKTSKRMVSVK